MRYSGWLQMKESDKNKKGGKRKGGVDDEDGDAGLLGAHGKAGFKQKRRN
jgi:hypothetical protein